MKRFSLALIGAIIAIVSCEKKEQEVPVTSVSITQATAEMLIGETIQLSASVQPSNATEKTISWASSKISVATVAGGKVTAIAEGSSIITASCGGKSASCSITVKKKVVDVTSVELNKTELTLVEGESETLVATVKPDDATDKTVTWNSSDQAVVAVDKAGKITAVKPGSATIMAKAGEKSASCAVTVSKKVIPVESVELNKSTLALVKGESEILVATVKPDDVTDKTVTWSSSKESVATVDQTGKVTAIGGGEATVTAKSGDKTASCTVAVTVPVSSLSLNKETLALVEGDSETLVVTVKPDDATDKTVTWSSSNAQIAAVDQNGKITAAKEGTAIITAKAGEESASCAVTVSKKVIPVESIELNKSSLVLDKGASETLGATVKPDDATDKTVTWSTSKASIASVDQTGKVTAVAGGEATITAKAGEKTATCVITVSVPVSSVSLDKQTLTLFEGDSQTLVATVSPDDASDKTITWSSTNTAVVTVDNSGEVVAIKEGTVTVIAKAGEKSASCAVTVSKRVIPVESIELNKSSLALAKGESETLVATVNPDDATDKTITWSSSKESIASVDQTGKVTAVAGGEATITAKAGEESASCIVNVTVPVTLVSLNKGTLSLIEGESDTLIVTVKPDDATDKTITWESSNTATATVDNSGTITAIKEGVATITAKAGEESASCEVIVEKYDPSIIHFADPKVKEKLVAAFDTNHDGKLSYEEAASVTSADDIKAAFGAIKTYKSFDEFQFFTGVNSIPNSMFEAWRLSSIILPNSIESIGDYAFRDCSSLSSIILPESVSSIGDFAFQGCSGLTSISIPEIVTSLGVYAFYDCNNLKSITIPAGVTFIGDFAFSHCRSLTSVSIPKGVTLIRWYTFQDCSSLTSVTIPESVTRIEGGAFQDCSSLSSIILPESVSNIDDSAFIGCISLKSITIPESVTSIGERAFQRCSSLTSITIPESVTSMGNYVFCGCSSLTSISIPESISSIAYGTFFGCSSLTSITIPESVTNIGGCAFRGCSSLTSITIPESVTSIGGGAFQDCSSLSSIILPESVSSIGDYAFRDCSSLSSIILPESVTRIEDGAFQDCSSLSSIILPESISSIGYSAFYGCSSLRFITIPESVTSIRGRAFYGCTSLEFIYVNALSVPEGGDSMFAFTNGAPIYVPAGSVAAYKAKQYWDNYADRIQAKPE